jgi:DNA-binding response OmpR family regulator
MKSTGSQTILLVEDEENDVAFMKIAMTKAGIASGLQVAEDGEQAIAYLGGRGEFADRSRHPLPALVLLDLKLPQIMGMEVLKWIRSQPGLDMTVVIILTSSQQRSDIHMACSLGANSYLVKPSNPLHLVELVGLVKHYWLQLNHPTAAFAAAPPTLVQAN